MFPIPWNFPFRKKDGSLGKIEDLGSSYSLPTASAETKGGVKIGSGLTMEGEVLNNSNPTPYTLPTASAETKGGVKIGTGLTMTEDVLSADAQVPAHTSAEEGKVLSVDSNGLLEWATPPASGGKLYYKDFSSVGWTGVTKLAKWESDAAGNSGYQIANCDNLNIGVSGYTPVSALAYDKYTGYYFNVGLQYYMSGGNTIASIGVAVASRTIDSGALGVRVIYAKNEDLVVVPS